MTVWKTFGDICYIIPDKYYGLTKPSHNFIKTTNDNYIVLFTSQELPNQIIYWGNRQDRDISIENHSINKIKFVNYLSNKDSLKPILYKTDATKVRDLRENAEMLDINIEDYYATDKNAKRM